MDPADKWLYEYAIIRLVPRIDREEFINIGLLMLCKRQKWLKGKVCVDMQKIKGIFPDADISQIKGQSELFEKTDVPQKDLPVEEKYRWLTAAKSAMLQTSPSHPGIISVSDETHQNQSSLENEFERLFKNLVL